MGKINRFSDTKHTCWSQITLRNGDDIYISIASAGIIVKKSKMGILGAKLFSEDNITVAAAVAQELDFQNTYFDLPVGMNNPALRAFTQAVLESESAAAVGAKLFAALKIARG